MITIFNIMSSVSSLITLWSEKLGGEFSVNLNTAGNLVRSTAKNGGHHHHHSCCDDHNSNCHPSYLSRSAPSRLWKLWRCQWFTWLLLLCPGLHTQWWEHGACSQIIISQEILQLISLFKRYIRSIFQYFLLWPIPRHCCPWINKKLLQL